MARFERESQVLASFNHPHIVTIHGLEENSGVHALVTELVDLSPEDREWMLKKTAESVFFSS